MTSNSEKLDTSTAENSSRLDNIATLRYGKTRFEETERKTMKAENNKPITIPGGD